MAWVRSVYALFVNMLRRFNIDMIAFTKIAEKKSLKKKVYIYSQESDYKC